MTNQIECVWYKSSYYMATNLPVGVVRETNRPNIHDMNAFYQSLKT